jgi:hypothetical protein
MDFFFEGGGGTLCELDSEPPRYIFLDGSEMVSYHTKAQNAKQFFFSFKNGGAGHLVVLASWHCIKVIFDDK